MVHPLELSEQIEAASRMALRCHVHLQLWRLTAGFEGRQRHKDMLEEYWEHFRFLEHGQLVTAIVELHSLLDADKSTINLPRLVTEVEHQVGPQPLMRSALARVQPAFGKVRRLRNNVYAHRTNKKTYNDVFKQAQVSPDEIHETADVCVAITNELRASIGLDALEPSPLPSNSYHRMLEQLGKSV